MEPLDGALVARDPSSSRSSLDDGRVVEALEAYLSLRRAGERPDRSEFLARHPEIAGVLADCLDGLEFVQGATDDSTTSGPTPFPMSLPTESLAPSTRLGDFRIVREVGRGGMGVVYEADQISLGRRVALKVLPGAASLDPRHRQRFQVEAQAAALLHHPHIVPVFAVGSEGDVPYYAMQFIEGYSLATIMENPGSREGVPEKIPVPPAGPSSPPAPTRHPGVPGPARTGSRSGPAPENVATARATSTPQGNGPATILAASSSGSRRSPFSGSGSARRAYARTIARFGRQAALALDHAHGVGVVHRDIKPSNLMVDETGHLWVTDFGLARIQADPGVTRTGDLVGTLRYMSPEQVRGDRLGIEPRTDIYALGVTLYELLTRKPAFEAPSHERLLQKILQDEPVALRKIDPTIPRDLETIVLKAMSKEPNGRYAGARDLADDLARFLDDRPILARRPGPIERSIRWGRRHRTVVATALTVFMMALIVGTGLLWQAKQRTDEALKRLQAAKNGEAIAFHRTFNMFDMLTFPLMKRASESGILEGDVGAKLHANAAIFYNQVIQDLQKDGGQRELVAIARRRTANLHALFKDRRALQDYIESIRLYEEHTAEHPDFIWVRGDLIATLLDYRMALESFELLDAGPNAGNPPDPIHRAIREASELLEDPDSLLPCFRPGLVIPFNDLAWIMVTRPGVTPEEADLAVMLARRAVETELGPGPNTIWVPPPGALWNTLGVALYRAGDIDGALRALTTSMAHRGGGDPYDWYFLAMIHHRRGNPEESRRWQDRVGEWLRQSNRPELNDPVFRRIREEAETVLRTPPERLETPRRRPTPVVPTTVARTAPGSARSAMPSPSKPEASAAGSMPSPVRRQRVVIKPKGGGPLLVTPDQ